MFNTQQCSRFTYAGVSCQPLDFDGVDCAQYLWFRALPGYLKQNKGGIYQFWIHYGGYNESANWYLLFTMVIAYVCLIRGLRHNFNIVSLITPNFCQYSAFFWLEVYLNCCAPSTPTVFDGIDCAQSIASSLKIVAQPFFPTSSKIVENMWLPCWKRRV